MREQSDTYIRTLSCHVLFKKWVFQTVVVYDKYQSCVDRVDPFVPSPIPLMGSKETKAALRQSNDDAKRRYKEIYGNVKKYTLIYKNKSNYDTRLFKGVLSGEKN